MERINNSNFLLTKTTFHILKWKNYDDHFWKTFANTLNGIGKIVSNGEFYP